MKKLFTPAIAKLLYTRNKKQFGHAKKFNKKKNKMKNHIHTVIFQLSTQIYLCKR